MRSIVIPASILAEWGNIHPTLDKVFWTLLNLWPASSLRITSLNRSRQRDRQLGGSGVHAAGPPWRAVDIGIRVLDTVRGGAQTEAERLADLVNSMWVYDPTRPHLPVCYAKPHGDGPHIHLQVHHLTRRKEGA